MPRARRGGRGRSTSSRSGSTRARYAESTAASIYDAGNMVIWWLGIPAMAFVAYQAFKRRSLALALILVAFLCQWVSWARIDRAAFQYHYYTSLPFVVLALGLLHRPSCGTGASRRTWLLARVAGGHRAHGPGDPVAAPLPAVRGSPASSRSTRARRRATGNPGNLVVTPRRGRDGRRGARHAAGAGRLPRRPRPAARATDGRWADRDLAAGRRDGDPRRRRCSRSPGCCRRREPLFDVHGIVPELIALIVAIPLRLIAIQVLTARDARRFVLGLRRRGRRSGS